MNELLSRVWEKIGIGVAIILAGIWFIINYVSNTDEKARRQFQEDLSNLKQDKARVLGSVDVHEKTNEELKTNLQTLTDERKRLEHEVEGFSFTPSENGRFTVRYQKSQKVKERTW